MSKISVVDIEEHYRKFFDKYVNTYYGKVGCKYMAEDIVQEAFTKILEADREFSADVPIGYHMHFFLRDASRAARVAEHRGGMVGQ